MDIGVATHKLESYLYPSKEELETAIANDNALIETTQANMEFATATRNEEQLTYTNNMEEARLTIEAIDECTVLL